MKIAIEELRSNGFEHVDEAIDAYEPGGCVRCGGSAIAAGSGSTR